MKVMEQSAVDASVDGYTLPEGQPEIIKDVHDVISDQNADITSDAVLADAIEENEQVEDETWSGNDWESFEKSAYKSGDDEAVILPKTSVISEVVEDFESDIIGQELKSSILRNNVVETQKNLPADNDIILNNDELDKNSKILSPKTTKNNKPMSLSSKSSTSPTVKAVHDNAGSPTAKASTQILGNRYDQTENNWQSWNVSQPSSPSLSTSSSNASKSAASLKKAKKANKVEVLGQEFDIQIKSVEPAEDIDFFADMQPVYTAPDKSIKMDNLESGKKSNNTSLFTIRSSTTDSTVSKQVD